MSEDLKITSNPNLEGIEIEFLYPPDTFVIDFSHYKFIEINGVKYRTDLITALLGAFFSGAEVKE